MASSNSAANVLSVGSSFVASSSPPSVSTSQRCFPPPPLRLRALRLPSSKALASTSLRPQAAFPTSATNDVPSISSSSTQIPSPTSIDTQITPVSHRPTIIAAISASTAGVLLLLLFAILLYRRRLARPQPRGSMTSVLRKPPGDDEKGWNDSPRSTPGSGWPEDSTTWVELQTRQSLTSFSGKGPHYTVRAHPSVSDVYGFGQDVAWQEAHYEDPLPVSPPPSRSAYPPIDVIPPTPPSGVIHHNTASAMPLLRSHSAASSISSVYSTASMVIPDLSAPPDIMTQASVRESLDDRNWLVDVQAPPSNGQGPRCLV
ncbi:hypothetical protein DFH09DRAFT_1157090 [Mycena vulgaris]|nr:hypothetical protein DFH09DRAFT_1157090 [Mycena vulgaris]